MRFLKHLAACLVLVTTTVSGSEHIDFEARLEASDQPEGDWQLHGRSYMDQRYSPLSSINHDSLADLGLSWFVDFPNDGGQQATPLVVDGVMFVPAAWNIVYAFDAATGKELWRYDPEVPRQVLVKACCGPVTRGVAYWDNRVLLATLDGRLISLDAESGKPQWETLTVEPDGLHTITGAPRVVNGKVVIGNGGAEFGARGYVSAYDIQTGDMVWRFYTVPGDPSKPFENSALEWAAKTWHGEWWKVGGGGTVWDSMAFDPALNILYVGVGNSTPYNPMIRTAGKGDNLFVSSIVALNPDTGEYIWHFQTTPGDSWDYTATQNMILADLRIEDQIRRVIMQAPKNGFFYVLDRKSGKFIDAEPFSRVTWASGIDPETGRPEVAEVARWWAKESGSTIFPSSGGAHNWQPMAMHPGHGLVYIPVNVYSGNYRAVEEFEFRVLGRNTGMAAGAISLADPAARKAAAGRLTAKLLAWDPVSGKPVWQFDQSIAGNGGVLATGGDLVFQGTADGFLTAHDAGSGKLLWRFDAQTPVIAAPISYAVAGKQYVAVMAGKGGSLGRIAGGVINPELINRSRLLVFALDGSKRLPPAPPAWVKLPDWSEIEVDQDVVNHGGDLYSHYCSSCHGVGTLGGSLAPDLRYSPFSRDRMAFRAAVLDGVLGARGMASFAPVLTQEETEAIRHYVVAENKAARAFGERQRVGR